MGTTHRLRVENLRENRGIEKKISHTLGLLLRAHLIILRFHGNYCRCDLVNATIAHSCQSVINHSRVHRRVFIAFQPPSSGTWRQFLGPHAEVTMLFRYDEIFGEGGWGRKWHLARGERWWLKGTPFIVRQHRLIISRPLCKSGSARPDLSGNIKLTEPRADTPRKKRCFQRARTRRGFREGLSKTIAKVCGHCLLLRALVLVAHRLVWRESLPAGQDPGRGAVCSPWCWNSWILKHKRVVWQFRVSTRFILPLYTTDTLTHWYCSSLMSRAVFCQSSVLCKFILYKN